MARSEREEGEGMRWGKEGVKRDRRGRDDEKKGEKHK